MANPKIPQGYQGTYASAADGSATLIMVSRSDSITDYTEKKEHKPMANNQPTQQQMSMTDEQPQVIRLIPPSRKRNTQSSLPNAKLPRTAKDSKAHTRIWGISASAIRFSFTTICNVTERQRHRPRRPPKSPKATAENRAINN